MDIFVTVVLLSARHVPLLLSDLVSFAARVPPASNGQSVRPLLLGMFEI